MISTVHSHFLTKRIKWLVLTVVTHCNYWPAGAEFLDAVFAA
jgi:hypothetical protein